MPNTFWDLKPGKDVNDVIVSHMGADLDAYGSAWALKNMLLSRYKIKAQVKFIKTPTYCNMPVNPHHQFDMYTNDTGTYRVWHVDTGNGALDHHHNGSGARSAFTLVVKACGLIDNPVFAETSRLMDLGDQGMIRSGLALPLIIQGLNEVKPAHYVFEFVAVAMLGVMENSRRWTTAQQMTIQQVSVLSKPSLDGEPIAEYIEIEGFGRLGLVCGPIAIGKSMVKRMWKEGCDIVVAINLPREGAFPTIAVLTSNTVKHDLVELGIVSAIRKEEAKLRGLTAAPDVLCCHGDTPGMAWFAYCPEGLGRVIQLLHGSDKHEMPEGFETRIPLPKIVGIVKGCIHNSMQKA